MATHQDSVATLLRAYNKLRFLVVDDFENFRRSMKQMLRAFGCENIETASNGKEAVDKCTYERVDVVLCDYNLGPGKNGQQILEELRYRKLLKHTSIFILITAETSRDMVMGAREYQPDAYITKPITQAALQKRLDNLIEQREALLPINRELDLEDYPKAISLVREMLPQQPRYRNWLLRNLAHLYFLTGDYSHARKIYEDILGARDMPWARLGLARVLAAENQPDEAIGQLKNILDQHADFIEAYDLMAEIQSQQGKERLAQTTLETAIRISPNAVVRHRHLAQVATRNQDMETASGAWRATVKLGEHSVHDSAQNYLNLSRTLAELSDGDTGDAGRGQADEAISILNRMQRRFRDDESAKLNALLIESRVHSGQGRQNESRKLLEQAQASIDPDSVDAETGLELARTLYVMGDTPQAEQLLNTLAKRYENDPEVIQRIEALMDEPVGYKKRIQARGLNRDGIKAFEEGRLDEAAKAFESALALVPRHPALNLNLVQVLLKRVPSRGGDTPDLRRCRQCLEQISHVPPQHRQYKRFQYLKGKVDALGESA